MNTNDNNKEIHDDTEIVKDCIFCKIIRNEIPAVKIYEDNETLAFLDINPDTKGHTLIIPKNHHENIYSIPVETWCLMNITAQKLAIAIKNSLSADGINIIMNNESAAHQLIFHGHIHIIPRYNDFEDKKYTYIAGEMEELAKEIKEVI
jgi:histidine triad (HIT) family protein